MIKLGNTTIYVYVIIAEFIVLFACTYIIRFFQTKRAIRQFNAKIYDEKTIRYFIKTRKRAIFPNAAEIHDLSCVLLSVIYIDQQNMELFYANLNDIKVLTDKTTRRLNTLLTAYLSDQDYHDLSQAYAEAMTPETDCAEYMKQLLQQHNWDTIEQKAEMLKAHITNEKVLSLLDGLLQQDS